VSQIQSIVNELIARGQVPKETVTRAVLDSLLFDKQLAVKKDPSRKIAVHTGRRGGKTDFMANDMLDTGLVNPGSMIPYIALTKDHARRLMLPKLRRISEEVGIPIRINENTLFITMENGTKLWLTGAKDIKEIEKLRGDAYPKVYVDECGSMPAFLQYLIEDVLKWALMDYDGRIVCVSTPPPSMYGYFYDICHSSTWSVHHWYVADNCMFPQWRKKVEIDGRLRSTNEPTENWKELAQKFVQDWLDEEGWSENNPTATRELFGKFVRDDNSLVYKYDKTKNSYDGIYNNPDAQYVIGIDFGYESLTAWVVWAFDAKKEPIMYQVYEYGEQHMMPHKIAEKTKELYDRYPNALIVGDPGSGRNMIEEMNRVYHLPVEVAQKVNKVAYIEMLNSDLFEGRMKCIAGSEQEQEWLNHQWVIDFGTGTRSDGKRKEGATPNHFSDATLYAWRRAFHWTHKPIKQGPKAGTTDWVNKQADDYWKRQEKEGTKKSRWRTL
jgi:hypothetical protein